MVAKYIAPHQIEQVLASIEQRARRPLHDRVLFLLTCRAGLRAQEAAGLSWRDVTAADGTVGPVVVVPNGIAKRASGRVIDMHDALRDALRALHAHVQPAPSDPVCTTYRGQRLTPNHAAKILDRVYLRAGLQGCSSHTGRRTLLTTLAREAANHGCSIFDVQRVAGHKRLETTALYLTPSPNVANLIKSL
jgi:integrase